jgi:pilus assembly protein Flp/PilA
MKHPAHVPADDPAHGAPTGSSVLEPAPPTPPAPRSRVVRLFARFGRRQEGATAVEFALIAVPFFMLMFAIIEVTMLFWTAQAMEAAVANASRVLLTGQALTKYPNSATALASFKNDICARVTVLINCQDNVQVDVRSYASFATANAAATVSGGNLDTSAFAYQQPGPQQIYLVRAVMAYPLYVPIWSQGLANLNGNKRAIVATTAFRTEPF